jgi:hypothetical protein
LNNFRNGIFGEKNWNYCYLSKLEFLKISKICQKLEKLKLAHLEAVIFKTDFLVRR